MKEQQLGSFQVQRAKGTYQYLFIYRGLRMQQSNPRHHTTDHLPNYYCKESKCKRSINNKNSNAIRFFWYMRVGEQREKIETLYIFTAFMLTRQWSQSLARCCSCHKRFASSKGHGFTVVEGTVRVVQDIYNSARDILYYKKKTSQTLILRAIICNHPEGPKLQKQQRKQ